MQTDTRYTAELVAEQDERELYSIDEGVRRFREMMKTGPTTQQPGVRQLLAAALTEMVDGVETERLKLESGVAMRHAQYWAVPFLLMDPGAMSLATLSWALNQGTVRDRGTDINFVSAISGIGAAVENEYHMMVLRTEAPKLKRVMDRRVKQWTPRVVAKARQKLGELGRAWPVQHRRSVGRKMLEILILRSGVFEPHSGYALGKRFNRIVIIPEVQDRIVKANELVETHRPVLSPMVVPPKPWSSEESGGYRLLSHTTDFVRRRELDGVGPEPQPEACYESVNVLQDTGWRTNARVLRCVMSMIQAGGGSCGLPEVEDRKVSAPFPEAGSEGEQSEWKRRAAAIHRYNGRMVTRRQLTYQTVAAAEELLDRVFYFPYNVDFRGRVYTIPTTLDPQRGDLDRGLLTLADTDPLGPHGYGWLLVQFANCWGMDKEGFAHRRRWAQDKLPPVGYMEAQPEDWDPMHLLDCWARADDPWQALAALIEIVEAHRHGSIHTYECSLPIGMDGTNSGLQHFSAMLRDEVGGALVNLVPADKPQDIYSMVSELARTKVIQDTRLGVVDDTTIPDLPQQWLDNWQGRKLAKRPAMTYVYNVTQQGMKDALMADGFLDWCDNPTPAVKYIGKKLWASVQESLPKATEAMEWLKTCAKLANRQGLMLRWTAPDGFIVQTNYRTRTTSRVRCLGCEVTFQDPGFDDPVSPHRQRNSVAPNYVHTFDAAHLRMSVRHGYHQYGVTQWAVVHDQFGTTPGRTTPMRRAVIESFVDIYRIDQLGRFRDEVVQQTGEDPGPPPEFGTLDIEAILESNYAFS